MLKFPDEILNCGGLIGRIADYTMDQAFRPCRELAVAGGMSWTAHCMSRRYRDAANTRPNIYLLALGWSGTGKDAPRDTNFRLAKACGLQKTVIEDFKSGEGLQDALLTMPKVLSQYDEVDGLFKSIKDAKNAVGANLCSEMLKIWNKSKNFMPRRKMSSAAFGKKDDKTPDIVYHPHFNLFATGVTSEVYRSIDSKMAMNGFFARLMVVDGGRRGPFHTPIFAKPPNDIVADCNILSGWQADASAWDSLKPDWEISGFVIPEDSAYQSEAKKVNAEFEAHYDTEEDGPYNSVWNRSFEKACKIAMILAASDCPSSPVLKPCHIIAAKKFIEYSNELQLSMFTRYAAETDYEDFQKRILRILEKGVTCNRAMLTKMHVRNEELKEAVETLHKAGKIIFCDANGMELPEYCKGVCYALA